MSLQLMRKRLNYFGGEKQHNRMVNDKLRGLKRALNFSYQSGTCVMPDGREFMMLMNPDKLKPDYDHKIISIPFEDVCLNKPRVGKTTEGIESVGMTPGVVFEWKENNSYWICYSQHVEEYAYFRGDCYACEDNIADVNGKQYHVYFKGPDQETIDWNTKAHDYWNKLNYTKLMWITKDEDTLAFYHRFTKCRINGQLWEVQTVNPDYGDGIIKVWVKEYYENSIEDAAAAQIAERETPSQVVISPYDIYEVSFPYVSDGVASLGNYSNDNIKPSIEMTKIDGDTVYVSIKAKANKAGEFDLFYGDNFVHCVIESL